VEIELYTDRLKLKDILPDRAKDIAKKYKLKEDDIEFIRKKNPLNAEDLQIEDGERAAIRYINTADVDRDNEIVLPSGGQVSDFKKSPTVLYAHDYHGLPIGKDIWIKLVQGKGWLAKTVYAKHQLAVDVYNLVKEKFLNTSSIGFIPLESVKPEDKDWDKVGELIKSEYGINEKIFDKAKRIYTKWILLEHSDVPIPSNINALNVAVGKGLEIKSEALRKDLGIYRLNINGIEKSLPREGMIEVDDEKNVNKIIEEIEEETGISEEEKEVITKPEETEDYIHIPVIDAGKFVDDSFRTIDIDANKGIKAVIGKLKSDPQGSTHVQKYIFDKSKGWTLSSAQEWVQKHGKSIIYQCVICDKYFMDSLSANRKTCSIKCGYKYLSHLNSGEKHPQYKNAKEKRICEQCGKIFETYKRSNQKYCSIECHNKSMEINKEIGICPVCGNEFDYYLNKPQIYCSRECFYKGNKEFISNLNKNKQLSEAQLKALEKGRINGFGGYPTECNDGHIVQSKFEAEFDNWLFEENIKHDIQVKVCNERAWTCDFVLINSYGESLWIEIDGMGELRKEYGHKETWEEKITYYRENDYRFIVIDKENIEESKHELKNIFPKQEESQEEEPSKGFNFDEITKKKRQEEKLKEIGLFDVNELYEIVKENKELKFLLELHRKKLEEIELKAGAVLNRINKQDLKDAQAKIQKVLDSAEPAEENGEEGKEIEIEDDGLEIEEKETEEEIEEPENENKGIDINEKELIEIIHSALKENINKSVENVSKNLKEGIDDNFKRLTGKVM